MSIETLPAPPGEASGRPPARLPAATRQARLELVERFLHEKRRTGLILALLREAGHVVCGSQLRADVRAIRAKWARESSVTLEQERLEVIRAHKGIRNRALQEGDLSVARLANRDLARFTGLDTGDVLVFLPGSGEGATARLVSVVDVARALRARREQAALGQGEHVVEAEVVATNGHATNGRNGHA